MNAHSLVSLQAVLEDTQEQLQEVQERCDRLIEEDAVGVLVSVFGRRIESTLTLVQRREVSERQEQVRWLREQQAELHTRATGSASLSMFPVAFADPFITATEEIEHRRGLISRRREILQQARALHEQDQQALIDQQLEIEEERYVTIASRVLSIHDFLQAKACCPHRFSCASSNDPPSNPLFNLPNRTPGIYGPSLHYCYCPSSHTVFSLRTRTAFVFTRKARL